MKAPMLLAIVVALNVLVASMRTPFAFVELLSSVVIPVKLPS